MNKALENLNQYWQGLQERERLVLVFGAVFLLGFLFYLFILQPWHRAIDHMESVLPSKRANLVWLQQRSDTLERGGGIDTTSNRKKGEGQSLVAVLEQTAKRARVRQAIQQMVPANQGQEVRVVMEQANFNQWLAWIDVLHHQYGVNVKQLSAEREIDELNVAEIRATFVR